MENNWNDFEGEIEDLKNELENFQKEKERVRGIIGKIGGVPTFNTKFINNIFISIVLVTLVVSFLFKGGEVRLLMIELATVALSIKIIYMMHCQSRVNHFQVWMQSSIEWRINEIMKLIRKIDDKT